MTGDPSGIGQKTPHGDGRKFPEEGGEIRRD
jgi:hypothetical protein